MTGRIDRPGPDRGGQPVRGDPEPVWQQSPWDGVVDRRRPTTAELAVPWLIGIILLLVGVSGFLLFLLLTIEGSGLGADGSPTPAASVAGTTGTPGSTSDASGLPVGGPVTTSPAPTAVPTPTPEPLFGELEIAFLARDQPAAPISVMRDDFGDDEPPAFVAQAIEGITSHDWAPDGSVAAGIIGGGAVAIVPGEEPRPLVANVAQITFGADATTLYAVRVADDAAGTTETSTILAIDFATGEEREITSLDYENPRFVYEGPLDEAQFLDEGGSHRLYWLADGYLCLSVFAGPTVTIDPGDGTQRSVERQPVLSSPDGGRRIDAIAADDGTTALELLTADGTVEAATSVTGAVSHLRWSADGERVAFTVGVVTGDGGVRQDLYLWTLTSEDAPTALTQNGAAFGAEWLGAPESWRV